MGPTLVPLHGLIFGKSKLQKKCILSIIGSATSCTRHIRSAGGGKSFVSSKYITLQADKALLVSTDKKFPVSK